MQEYNDTLRHRSLQQRHVSKLSIYFGQGAHVLTQEPVSGGTSAQLYVMLSVCLSESPGFLHSFAPAPSVSGLMAGPASSEPSSQPSASMSRSLAGAPLLPGLPSRGASLSLARCIRLK